MKSSSALRTVCVPPRLHFNANCLKGLTRAVSISTPARSVCCRSFASRSVLPRATLGGENPKTTGSPNQADFSPEKSSLSQDARDRANLLAEISKPQSRQNQTDRSKASDLLEMLEVVAEENDSHGSGIAVRQGSLSKSLGIRPAQNSTSFFQGFSGSLPVLDAPLRLDAFVGRSEPVQGPGGLATALRKLEVKCALNKVKIEAARQRFHERPGLKRKRLRSERWRARFKQGFVATVMKVQRLKKQGW